MRFSVGEMGFGSREKTKREFVKVLLTLVLLFTRCFGNESERARKRERERERQRERQRDREGEGVETARERERERETESYPSKSNKDPSGLSTWARYVVFLLCVFLRTPATKVLTKNVHDKIMVAMAVDNTPLSP